MTGEKCISCNDRFPGCQDHCEYGRAAKAMRRATTTPPRDTGGRSA